MQVSPGALQLVLPAQQGCPLPPQVAHLPPAQTVLAAVQVLPVQQVWLDPPQAVHCMFWSQMAPAAQVVPQQG